MTESKYILEMKDLVGETITHVKVFEYWDNGVGLAFASGKCAWIDARSELDDPEPLNGVYAEELAELLDAGWIEPAEHDTLVTKIKEEEERELADVDGHFKQKRREQYEILKAEFGKEQDE